MKLLPICVALIAATPAFASDPAAPSATISTAGLDFSDPADQRRFERRVASATERVCGSYAQAQSDEADRIAACRASVKAQLAAVRAKGQLARK